MKFSREPNSAIYIDKVIGEGEYETSVATLCALNAGDEITIEPWWGPEALELESGEGFTTIELDSSDEDMLLWSQSARERGISVPDFFRLAIRNAVEEHERQQQLEENEVDL